jgi:hypothetical protein
VSRIGAGTRPRLAAVAGLCSRQKQQQGDRDHDDDRRDEEQGLMRKWSAKGERHNPSYRPVPPFDARGLPRSN